MTPTEIPEIPTEAPVDLSSFSAISAEFKAAYARLLEHYGSHRAIPPEEVAFHAEVMRARHVLRANPGETNITQLLRRYAVTGAVIAHLTGVDTLDAPERPVRRADKYAKILAWTKEHVGATVTLYQLAEIGEVSYSTANKLVKDRPDLFSRQKKGAYLVRDPEAERKADKG